MKKLRQIPKIGILAHEPHQSNLLVFEARGWKPVDPCFPKGCKSAQVRRQKTYFVTNTQSFWSYGDMYCIGVHLFWSDSAQSSFSFPVWVVLAFRLFLPFVVVTWPCRLSCLHFLYREIVTRQPRPLTKIKSIFSKLVLFNLILKESTPGHCHWGFSGATKVDEPRPGFWSGRRN